MHICFDKKDLIVYFLILALCTVFASFYGGLLPFILLGGFVLLLPVSFVCIVLSYRFLSVYQELDSHRVVKGDSHDMTVTFDNSLFLPIHNMILTLYSDRCDHEGIADGQRVSVGPRSKITLHAKASCLFGGAYYIGVRSIGLSDAFSIMTVEFDVPYHFRAIVSPNITDAANGYLDIENTINSVGIKSDMKIEMIPGNDMRNYVPGDAPRSINWKVSAKLDKLMVRVPDKQDTRTVTMVLEASYITDRDWDTEYLRRRDAFLEFAVSAAWYFAKRNMPVLIIYPSGKITERHVGSYDSFRGFYEDVSQGMIYRSEDEKDRMHRLSEERRMSGYGDETTVVVSEDRWPGEDFCVIAG
ncbi:MAG: DUF58 domain-containing protein [Lachnospiraceae bacterium]|nr:DUF58 domain-containing protein [Lachnospiraceae bacterium]